METKQARPLAYTLAKELNHKEIDEVSGGGNNTCVGPTFHISGNSASMDVELDVRADW